MRYVKTRNKIYPVIKMQTTYRNTLCYITEDGEVIDEKEVLKSSSDLEELFDEYVVLEDGKLALINPDKNWIDYDLAKRIKPTLLGAIACFDTKGTFYLLSVAKYNKVERKWELID